MEFRELVEKYDEYSAFHDWVSVKNAKRLNKIPEKYAKFFKDRCECGSENIIKYELSQMMCCNPKCYIKQGKALSELFSRFGIKGIGPAICASVYEALVIKNRQYIEQGFEPLLLTTSYVEILRVPFDKYPIGIFDSAAGRDFYRGVTEILTTKLTFPVLMGKLAIPSLDNSSKELFDGINSYSQFKKVVEIEGGLRKYCAKRGCCSEWKLFWLYNSQEDMYVADYLFRQSIQMQGLSKMNVCMTGRMLYKGSPTTKEKFINMCNDMCKTEEGIQLLEITITDAVATNPYIIYSQRSSDRKFLIGQDRGIEYNRDGTKRKVLVTCEEFVEELEKIIESLKQSYNRLKEENDKCKMIENTREMTSF